MEENNHPESPQGFTIGNFWKSNQRLIYMALAAILFIVLLVFGDDFFSSSKIFTQYNPTPLDSIRQSVDSTVTEEDKTRLTKVIESEPVAEQPEQHIDSINTGIFSVNTTYDKIVSRSIPDRQNTPVQEGLFEKMLLPQEMNPEFENFYETYRNENILSSQSMLKVLAIAGRSILLEHNDADDQLLMQVLTESEKVNGILIVNTEGSVVYATNRKYLNASLTSIMPEIDISKIVISWYQKADENIVYIPVFHTYGKIGTAVLITQI